MPSAPYEPEVVSSSACDQSNCLNPASSVHLDAIRGLAALIVFLDHWRNLFFVDFDTVTKKSFLIRCLYLIAGMGHQAVVIFFVLSGFFISRSVFRMLESGRWSWMLYAQQRLTRLYIVLLPALCLGAIIDLIGIHYVGISSRSIYGGSPEYHVMYKDAIRNHETLRIWLGNLFFLQWVRVPVFGSNGPLWSLSYEFWYYLIFPLLPLAFAQIGSTVVRKTILLSISILLLLFVGKEISLYFLVWLMGSAISRFPTPPPLIIPRVALLLGLTLMVIGSLSAARTHIVASEYGADCIVGVAFSALIYAIVHYAPKIPSIIYQTQARFLSGISYTLYLTHVPALVFLNAWIIGLSTRWQPDLYHLSLGGGVALMTFIYVCVVWRITEANTESIRRWIDTRISIRSS